MLRFGLFKFGLSRRKKVPVFSIFGQSFLPHRALYLAFVLRQFKIVNEDCESVKMEVSGYHVRLLHDYAICVVHEWSVWQKHYLPDFSLKGKTVLDVGAGCGETVLFYILHGAKKVIAVEPDLRAVKFLKENVLENNWNVKIIPEPFKLEHLKLDFDFMKMDGEGCEEELLCLSEFKPCVVEVHNVDLMKKFQEKGFRKIYSFNKNIHLMARG